MSATLRFLEAHDRGDFDLPEHDGCHRFLVVLLRPILRKPGRTPPRRRASTPPRRSGLDEYP